MTFVDGSDFQCQFETPLGSIGILAECHIFYDHLVLDELLFYPTDTSDAISIGVRTALDIFRYLRNAAKEQGFSALTVSFHRAGPRHHGRTITFTRRLE